MLSVVPMSVALPTAGGACFRATGTSADAQERASPVDVQTSKLPNLSSVPLRLCASVLKIGARTCDERTPARPGFSGVGPPVGRRGRPRRGCSRDCGKTGGSARPCAGRLPCWPSRLPSPTREGREKEQGEKENGGKE